MSINFLQTIKLFSTLFIFLLIFILISSLIYINIFYSSFEDFWTNLLLQKYNEAIKNLKNDFFESSFLKNGEPLLLGAGIIYKDGTEKFYPKYSKAYWSKGKKHIMKKKFLTKSKPIKTGNIYFQIISSLYQDKRFLCIFDATTIGLLYEKFKILKIFIIIATIIFPFILYLVFKRAEKFYYAMLRETKENPLAEENLGEPDKIINILKKTNEELKSLLIKQKEKYNELEILANTLSYNLPLGLLIFNSKNIIIKANSYALKFLKINNLDNQLDKSILEYPELLKFIKEKIDQKKAVIKYCFEEKEKIFEFTIVPLFKEGIFLGTLILFQDLTEIKKLEETLKEKETLANLGTFSAGIAHEFRNSLSTIIGYAKLLKSNEENVESQKYIKSILEEATHINEVITSFLEYTKIQKIYKEECFIFDVFKNIFESLKTKYPSIDFILEGVNLKVNLDIFLFSQGMKAILENSCFEQKKGDIFINIAEEKEEIIIEIKDFAGGMDKETLKKIFIPFFSTKPSGTGLGLFFAHRIITLHNGKITVNSKKGVGTTFKITFSKEVLQNYTVF